MIPRPKLTLVLCLTAVLTTTMCLSPVAFSASPNVLKKQVAKLKKQIRKLKNQLANATRPVPDWIEFVNVGLPGNPADPIDGDAAVAGTQNFGSVPYEFRIAKYEVTLAQYTAFLNAVAATDTYNLYNANLASDANVAGIARSGTPGSYTYATFGNAARPVSYVSWFDAARFCNWLHHGRPTGAQNNDTTETGAYPLYGATAGVAIERAPGSLYWLPGDDEWYKVAYYQPPGTGGGDTDGYWTYPTRSNSLPGNQPGAFPVVNQANFRLGSNLFSITQSSTYDSQQNYLAPVGLYQGSATFFGAFDLGGNVAEWTDGIPSSGNRATRGGGWPHYGSQLNANSRNATPPTTESSSIGFRVATKP
ncbi:MAG: SUMF1/EgtB/PvdO family nonheme iron enzyme [Verrucomicrobiales bacterium]|nr:SUMF1/EgtB/PvdO family nonheme iron enzyme [Verrucomicrobiales bacterium]